MTGFTQTAGTLGDEYYTNITKMKTNTLLAQDYTNQIPGDGSTVAGSYRNNHTPTYPSLKPVGANGLYMDGSVLWKGVKDMSAPDGSSGNGKLYHYNAYGIIFYRVSQKDFCYFPPTGIAANWQLYSAGTGLFW